MRSLAEIPARVFILVLALAGASACGAAMETFDVESARTAAQVITAIVNDPEIGARPIGVQVTQGIVRLSGRVNSPDEERRAIELARAVPGVTRVESSLRIGAAPPPDPAAPPAAERRRSVRDPAVEFAELEPPGSRLAIGLSFGSSRPTSDTFDRGLSVGPLVRIGSGAGLGPAMGLDWYSTTLTPANPSSPASRVDVRPFMLGLAYTIVRGRVAISPSLVGGYAFNNMAVPDEGVAGRLPVDVSNSPVWRPGVSVWIDTGRRTAVNLSVGRLMTRLDVTFVDEGQIVRQSLDGHATLVSIGLAYRLF